MTPNGKILLGMELRGVFALDKVVTRNWFGGGLVLRRVIMQMCHTRSITSFEF